MQAMRPSRLLVYAVLALILFSQQIVPQTQSSTQQSTASTAASNAKPNTAKVNCDNNGTYKNSKGQTVPRPENCSAAPKGATAQCRDGTLALATLR